MTSQAGASHVVVKEQECTNHIAKWLIYHHFVYIIDILSLHFWDPSLSDMYPKPCHSEQHYKDVCMYMHLKRNTRMTLKHADNCQNMIQVKGFVKKCNNTVFSIKSPLGILWKHDKKLDLSKPFYNHNELWDINIYHTIKKSQSTSLL